MKVIKYQNKYKCDFIRLNLSWIERYFIAERADYDILNNIEELIDKGSMIYLAIEYDKVLAVCMAMPLENGVWEILKLAAANQYTGTGAGSAVFKACMDYAIRQGAEKISIISNTILKPALHIYKKFGFKEVPLDKKYWGFDRADIQFEYIVPKE